MQSGFFHLKSGALSRSHASSSSVNIMNGRTLELAGIGIMR